MKILRYCSTCYDEFCISGLHCSSLMTSLPVNFVCCKTFPYLLQTALYNWIFDILCRFGEIRVQTNKQTNKQTFPLYLLEMCNHYNIKYFNSLFLLEEGEFIYCLVLVSCFIFRIGEKIQFF